MTAQDCATGHEGPATDVSRVDRSGPLRSGPPVAGPPWGVRIEPGPADREQ
jgi:hypothetical protein